MHFVATYLMILLLHLGYMFYLLQHVNSVTDRYGALQPASSMAHANDLVYYNQDDEECPEDKPATPSGGQASDPDYYNQDVNEVIVDKPATPSGGQASDPDYYNQNVKEYLADTPITPSGDQASDPDYYNQ